MDRRSLIGFLLGLSVSVILLGYLFTQLEWSKFIAELRHVHPGPIPIVILLLVAGGLIRAIRWRWLLPSGLEISTSKLFSAGAIGALATCVLPLRAGEFVRPWVLARTGKVTFSRALASIVTERVFDVLAMLAMFACSLARIDHAPEWVTPIARSLGVLSGMILGVMLLAYFRGELVLRIFERIIRLLPHRIHHFQDRLVTFAGEGIAGLRAISSARELLCVLVTSILLWIEYSLTFTVALSCFDLPSPLAEVAHGMNAFWVGNTTNVFVALAVALPSAPGFFGTFHIGCLASLSNVYGASESFAAAYAVLNHSIQFLFTVALGFFMLQFEGLRFRQISVRNSVESPAT